MAQKYYPRLWNKSRLEALVQAKRLSGEEFTFITGTEYDAWYEGSTSDPSSSQSSSSSSSGGSTPAPATPSTADREL